jgi:hypothetical protein
MPSRKRRKIRVILEPHAELRWRERACRPPGNLANLIAALIIEHLPVGLPVRHGRAMLPLDPELLDLPRPLVAYLELPDLYGVWRVVSFVPGNERSVERVRRTAGA